MSNKKSSSDRWRGKFKQKIESGTLVKHEFDKLCCVDQIEYLKKELRRKYPEIIMDEPYVKFDCFTCAMCDPHSGHLSVIWDYKLSSTFFR